MLFKDSSRFTLVKIPVVVAVTLVLFLIPVFNIVRYSEGQIQGSAQNPYLIHIKMGASIPSLQATTPPYEPPILPMDPNLKGIPVNSIVKWINDDESFHTVTSGKAITGPDRQFDSGILSPKVSWQWTFSNPGEYNYYCTVHPFMTGLVRVAG
jgi:hypothetical protein